MEHKGEHVKVSFDRTMLQVLCGWQKGMSQDKAISSSAKIKPIAVAVIELRLSEGISK